MPRDGAGNYTLPAGNPVVSGEVITPTWANPTMDDIGIEMTDSLSRSGKGGMLVPFENVDGTIGDPGITFISEPTTGFSRTAVNVMNASVGGIQSTRWIAGNLGFEIWDGLAWVKPLTAATTPIVFTGVITISSLQPKLHFNDTDAALDEKNYLFRSQGGTFGLHTATDAAPTTIIEAAWQVNRTGTVVDDVTFPTLNIHTASIRMDGGAIILKNNLNMSGTPVSDVGTVRILRFSATDFWEIGQSSSAVQGHIYNSGNDLSIHDFQSGANASTAKIDKTGITLGIDRQLFARNTADTDFITIATKSFGSDVLVYGDANSSGSQYFGPTSASGHRFFIAGVEQFRIGSDGPALMNSIALQAREAGGTVRDMVLMTGSDNAQFGNDSNRGVTRAFEQFQHIVGGESVGFFLGRASGGVTVADISGSFRKAGFRNPKRIALSTGQSRAVLQSDEGQFIALNAGSLTLTFDALETSTRIRVLNVTGNGTAAEGAGAVIQRLTGTDRVDGAFSMIFGSVWEFYMPTASIWYAWEITGLESV